MFRKNINNNGNVISLASVVQQSEVDLLGWMCPSLANKGCVRSKTKGV